MSEEFIIKISELTHSEGDGGKPFLWAQVFHYKENKEHPEGRECVWICELTGADILDGSQEARDAARKQMMDSIAENMGAAMKWEGCSRHFLTSRLDGTTRRHDSEDHYCIKDGQIVFDLSKMPNGPP